MSSPADVDNREHDARPVEVQEADLHAIQAVGEVDEADLKAVHRPRDVHRTSLQTGRDTLRIVSEEARGDILGCQLDDRGALHGLTFGIEGFGMRLIVKSCLHRDFLFN